MRYSDIQRTDFVDKSKILFLVSRIFILQHTKLLTFDGDYIYIISGIHLLGKNKC